MRHAVFIDEGLLAEVREALGTQGVGETVEAGLKVAIRRHRLDDLRRYLEKINLGLTSEELTRIRSQMLRAER